MAIILLKNVYEYTGSQQYEQYTDYFYNYTKWEFDTATRQTVTVTVPITISDPSNAENYSRPTGEMFYWECLQGTTTRRDYYHNGNGGFTYQDTPNSTSCNYTPAPLTLLVQSKTNPTSATSSDGAATLLASGGAAAYEYRLLPSGPWVGSPVFAALSQGAYSFQVRDSLGALASAQVTLAAPVPPVYGCTDRAATNYNPEANTDDGTCDYPVPMTATLPAPLTVVGNPVEAVLVSGPMGTPAAKATAEITLGEMADGSALTVNGVSLTFSLEPEAGQFYNGSTLAQALADEETITLRYAISQPSFNQVRLEALRTGSGLTPEVSASPGITWVITPGQDGLRSQAYGDWGCYVEVWACSGMFGGEVDKEGAVLLERQEKLRQPGNSYRFDLAPVLSRNLRHALFTESDRMQAYFVRYGETYTPDGQRLRRRVPVSESSVLWTMEGALPLYTLNQVTAPRLLTATPGRLRTPLHGLAYAEALYVLSGGGTVIVGGKYTAFDGTYTEEESIVQEVPGGVCRIPLQPVYTRAFALDGVKKLAVLTLTVTIQAGSASSTLGVYTLFFQKQAENMRCVVFANSMGAYDTFWMEGLPETKAKRSTEVFSRGLPAVRTSSSRSLVTRSVTLERQQVLHTGVLDRETFEWLASEMAGSPDVFLFNPITSQFSAVNISDFDLREDVAEEEYSISLAVEPGLPINTLTN
ncbi:hypothetical protein [Rufibacter quisquiliarum]|uniref:Uncharacterized protein n=1 Tax=Rufibacter quisquiliarum TaxID=1549639 RepID=A0A839GHB1_9BACT|nr:hypothetical protein [Rufibacter quisquiliarum]MBA9076079.1 hypothetical protein [Rufibacter quisquiliarum]